MTNKALLLSALIGLVHAIAAFGQDTDYDFAPSPLDGLEVNLASASNELAQDIGYTSNRYANGASLVGLEATYLKPLLESRRAALPTDSSGLVDRGNFDYSVEAAPRILVGHEFANGIGFRTRYWQFDAEADPIREQDFDDDAEVIDLTSEMEAYTLDFEVTRKYDVGCWSLLPSLGLRHAAIANRFAGWRIDADEDDELFFNAQDIGRRMDGTGITAAIEGRKQTGRANISLVWNLRGSAVWGNNKANGANFDLDAYDDLDIDTDTDVVTSTDSDTLLIGEAQLGLEWAHQLQCGTVWIRGVAEYQTWGLGRHTLGRDFVADSLGQGDTDFFGGTVAAGISR